MVEQWLAVELEARAELRSQRPPRFSKPAPANDVRSAVIGVGDPSTTLHSVMLYSKDTGQWRIAGIAALSLEGTAPKLPEAWLVEALANALLENDDVDPATVIV